MPLLLGVDVGTTQVKAVVTDGRGAVLGRGARGVDLRYPHPRWAEQAPDSWWRAMAEATAAATAGVDRDDVVALALSTQAGAQTPVDAQGRPLRPARGWMDTRATREAEDLSREVGARAWFDRTGKAMSPKNTASFPRWLERHEPQVFRAAARYTEPQDYLVHRLTGVWSMDVSSAAYCGAFDARTRDWAPDLAAVARIRLDQLSPVRPCGRPVGPLTPEAAEALGLPRRVVVCGGAHDQTAAALGVGAVSPGQALLSAGTAWVLYAVASAYDPPARSDLLVLCHAVPGLYAVLGAWAGCSVFDWFVRECCEADRRDAQAAGRNVFDDLLSGGWEGDPLLCLPHFYGACDDPAARGAVLGLTLQHTRRDLVRAAAQGVAFEARRHRDILAAGGVRPQRLTMIGGAARSRVWPQIVADALDTPVETPEATDAAALGAALLAGRGAGVVTGWRFDAPPAAPPRAYAPDRASVGRADRLYRLYLQAMDRLRPA